MIIFPAIDLKDGKAVRLTKGEMNSAKIYSENPLDFAKQFEDMGAKWLHMVDLNLSLIHI
jgi:phosphoribosylformimino-5-aminoimidazole carboxamide ribotide isomerase